MGSQPNYLLPYFQSHLVCMIPTHYFKPPDKHYMTTQFDFSSIDRLLLMEGAGKMALYLIYFKPLHPHI